MMSSARRIARNTGLQAGADAGSKIATAAFYIVMARELGRSGFGDFMFAASVVMLIELAEFGTDVILTREVARDRRAVATIFWNAIGVKVGCGALGAGAALAIAAAGGYRTSVVVAVSILAAARIVELASKNAHAVLRGLEQMLPVALSVLLQRYFTAAAGIAAVLVGGSIVHLAVIYLAGALLALAYVMRQLVARLPGWPVYSFSLAGARVLLTTALPVGVSAIFTTVLARLDMTLLSVLVDNAAVGLYAAAYRLFESTLFISWSFGLAMLPVLSRLSATTRPTIGEAYATACKTVIAVLLPMAAVLALFADPITRLLYGDDFAPAAEATRAVSVAVVLYGPLFVSTNVLVAQDRQRPLVIISGIALVANIGLNLALIPLWSHVGAAVAMSASQAVYTVLAVGFALRATGAISVRRVLLAPTAGLAAMAVVASTGNGGGQLALSLAAYVVVAAAMERRFFPGDVSAVVQAVVGRPPVARRVP